MLARRYLLRMVFLLIQLLLISIAAASNVPGCGYGPPTQDCPPSYPGPPCHHPPC